LREIVLDSIEVPDFGSPTMEPRIPRGEYERRISLAKEAMSKKNLDALVVYGDREHNANMAFLCGYDPRFEESLLVLPREGPSTLMVGNEGWGYADAALQIEVEKVLVQCFSLIGQPRDRMKEITLFMKEAGIRQSKKVGAVGWKYFTEADFANPRNALEIPSYLADSLREIVGPSGVVVNANDILMDPDYGLRVSNGAEQIATFEFAATVASEGVREVIEKVEPGMTEYEAVQLMKFNGMPLSCHLMLSTGRRASHGLPSPSMKTIERGDPLTTALGLWGALICRQGYVVEGPSELAGIQPTYLKEVCIPYFSLVVDWYESMGIGATGGEIQDKVDATGFPLALNPGHLIHIDEWMSTPFYRGSKCVLKSGMAIQVDMIPKVGPDMFGTNLEDTMVMADEELRQDLETKYPETFKRIERRRNFVTGVLNVKIRPEIMPLSNYPAVLRPFLLDRTRILRAVR
jgi:Xaa-Pro aminopeptidase